MSFFHQRKRYKVSFLFEFQELILSGPLPAPWNQPGKIFSLHMKTKHHPLAKLPLDFSFNSQNSVTFDEAIVKNVFIKAKNGRLEEAKSKIIRFVLYEVDKGKERRSVARGEFDMSHIVRNGSMDVNIRLFPASQGILSTSTKELMQLRIRVSFADGEDLEDRSSVDTHSSQPSMTVRTASQLSLPSMHTKVVQNSAIDTTDILSAESHEFTDNTLSSLKAPRDLENLAVQVNLPTQEALHYQKKFQEAQNDSAELQRKIMKFKHQHELNVEKLESHIRSLEMENSDLEARVDSLQQNNNTLNADLVKTQSQLQRTDSEKRQYSSETDALRLREETLKSSLNAITSDKRKLEARYTKKKKDLLKRRAELTTLREVQEEMRLKSRSLEKRMQTGSLCLSFMLFGFFAGFLYILSLPFINYRYTVIHDVPPLDVETHFASSLEAITKKFVMSTVIVCACSAFGLRFSRRFRLGTSIIDYINNPYSLATSIMKTKVRNSLLIGFASALVISFIDMFLISRDPLSTSHTYTNKKVFLVAYSLYHALVEEIVGRVFLFSLCREIMLVISSKSMVSSSKKKPLNLGERVVYTLNAWALRFPVLLPSILSALLTGLCWECGLFGHLFSIYHSFTLKSSYSLMSLILFVAEHSLHAYLYVIYRKIELVVWLSFVSHVLVNMVVG